VVTLPFSSSTSKTNKLHQAQSTTKLNQQPSSINNQAQSTTKLNQQPSSINNQAQSTSKTNNLDQHLLTTLLIHAMNQSDNSIMAHDATSKAKHFPNWKIAAAILTAVASIVVVSHPLRPLIFLQ
jgi:hypothetical protein